MATQQKTLSRPAQSKKAVSHIPEGYLPVTPSLVVRGAAEAIDFYQRAFGAELRYKFDMPDGKVGHAELLVEGSPIMLGDEFPEMGATSPATLGGSPVYIWVYTKDADALVDRAARAGAKVTMPMADQFWGDRIGCVTDPFGHLWTFATHKEDLSEEEIKRRGEEYFAKADAKKA